MSFRKFFVKMRGCSQSIINSKGFYFASAMTGATVGQRSQLSNVSVPKSCLVDPTSLAFTNEIERLKNCSKTILGGVALQKLKGMDRPKQVVVRRRTKLTSLQNKKISDDEFMAAAIGDVEWLRQSIRSKGGALNYDQNGLTPLHLASIHGRLECLKLLIDKLKVDVNLASTTGWKPIHLVISNQTGKRSFQCLLYLLDKGADPSITNDDDITPMHQAASEGHVQCLKALIEVGARIDGDDRRGHKPIDLAKLWGHRKCARILGAEMWHREKDFLSKELYQLQKVKMQQVLREIEEDESNRFDQQFYGELAYRNWLQEKGVQKERKDGEAKDHLHKANSVQRKPSEKKSSLSNTKSLAGTNVGNISKSAIQSKIPQTPESEDGGLHEQRNDQEFDQGDNESSGDKLRHEYPWNISTHTPPYEYLPRLPDYYPRDEYTMQPRYPLKKGGRPAPDTNMIPIRHENINSAAKLRKPKLAPEILEKALLEGSSIQDRPVVYKCRNIIDVPKLKQYDQERLPKAEAAIHLCDDRNSALFKAALQMPLSDKSTSSTSLKSGGSSNSSSNLSTKFSALSLTDRI